MIRFGSLRQKRSCFTLERKQILKIWLAGIFNSTSLYLLYHWCLVQVYECSKEEERTRSRRKVGGARREAEDVEEKQIAYLCHQSCLIRLSSFLGFFTHLLTFHSRQDEFTGFSLGWRMLRSERDRNLRATTPALHWALIPMLAGVLIGVAFSTVFLLQPYTAITNVYLELPSPERGGESVASRFGESRDLQRLLTELGAARDGIPHSAGPPAKLADEANAKGPVYYAVVMSHRHSADQLNVLKETWTREIPPHRVGYYINSEEGPTEEDIEDRHYGEIESSEVVIELSSTGADFYTEVVSHVCRHKLNHTKWYLLAGDDVYVKSKELESRLHRYENMPALGYLGRRSKDEVDSGRRECLEGPGMVLSHSVLCELCRELETCRQRGEGVGACLTGRLGQDCNELESEASSLSLGTLCA